jgi:hypothetical protein
MCCLHESACFISEKSNVFLWNLVLEVHTETRAKVFLRDCIKFKWKMIKVMSMGWGYVSELRPPTGLLFIRPMICERGDPWGIDIRRGKLPIRLPELSGNPTSRVVAKQNNWRRKLWIGLAKYLSEVEVTNFEEDSSSYKSCFMSRNNLSN